MLLQEYCSYHNLYSLCNVVFRLDEIDTEIDTMSCGRQLLFYCCCCLFDDIHVMIEMCIEKKKRRKKNAFL